MEKLLYALLIAIAGIFSFSGLRNAEAVWDLRQNAVSAEDTSLGQQLKNSWKPDPTRSYTPLTSSVDAIVHAWAPKRWSALQVSHALQLSLHVMNAILVMLLLSLVLASSGAAFWGGLLFALHPLQVEAVVLPSSLGFVLAAFFSLASLWQFFVYQTQDSRQNPSQVPIRIATLSFIAALLSSPVSALTPLLALILLQVKPAERSSSYASPQASPLPLLFWALLAIAPFIWAIRAQDTAALAAQIPLWARPLIAGDALAFYFGKLFVPYGLGPDYGRSPAYVLAHWWGYLTFALPIVLLLALGFLRDLRAYYFAAFGLFALALLPFLGFVLFPALSNSTVADSFAYLALLGPALALAATFTEVRSGWLPALSVVLLAGLGFATYRQIAPWRSNESLWDYAVKANPQSPKVHRALAEQAMKERKWDEAKEHYEMVLAVNKIDPLIYFQLGTIESAKAQDPKSQEQAIAYYEQALRLDPLLVEAHGRLGMTYYQQKKYDQALTHFIEASNLAPEHPLYLRYRGLLAVERGRYAEGLPFLQKALTLSKQDQPLEKARIHASIGLAMLRTGQAEAARQNLEEALALDPQQIEAHRMLADIYFDQKRWRDAQPHYELAQRAAPQDPELLTRLGFIRLQNKQYDKAIASFTEALRQRPNAPEVLTNLGTAYYHLRRFPEASATLRKSLAINAQQAEPHYLLGEIGRWQGVGAVAEFEQALKIDPDHVESRYRLGNWHLKNMRFVAAARQYQEALRVAPDDARLKAQLQKAVRGEPDNMAIEAVSR